MAIIASGDEHFLAISSKCGIISSSSFSFGEYVDMAVDASGFFFGVAHLVLGEDGIGLDDEANPFGDALAIVPALRVPI